MTKPRNLTITIPEPCTVPWNTMHTVDDYRRHCDSCATVVTDFSSMTDDELVSYLQNKVGQHTCGRFRKDQLGKPLPLLPVQKRKAVWWKAALLLPFSVWGKSLSGQNSGDQINSTLTTQQQDSVQLVSSQFETDSLDQIIEPIAEQPISKNDTVCSITQETENAETANRIDNRSIITLFQFQNIVAGSMVSYENVTVMGNMNPTEEEIVASRFESLRNIASFFVFFKTKNKTVSAGKENLATKAQAAILPQTTSISELNPRSRNRKPNNPTA